MIFHPAILALLAASLLSAVMVVGGAGFGATLLAGWDIRSGSHRQLVMERRTYLVSTLLGFVLAAELLSILLFVFNAERMSVQFVGAMCAVGTLNVNAFGFPALIAKVALFFLAAVWLILNHADNLGHDYPLIRVKYALLIALAPVVLAAGGLQLAYFLNLNADVITSCCSKLFTPESEGVAAEMAGLDEGAALWLMFAGLAAVLGAAAVFLRTGRGGIAYAVLAGLFFVLAMTAVVSVLSPYVYEHPNHHCPFCILKPEYGFFGYLYYIPLFVGTACGLGVGPILPFRDKASLRAAIPTLARRLVAVSAAAFALFGLAAVHTIQSSALRLFDGGLP